MDLIHYADFSKLEFRVGLIRSAEKVEGTEKLLKLLVDVGEPEIRTLVAGLGQSYPPEELVNKKIIVLCNLEPKKLRGIESQGMLLAAGEDPKNLRFLKPDQDMPVGTRIY